MAAKPSSFLIDTPLFILCVGLSQSVRQSVRRSVVRFEAGSIYLPSSFFSFCCWPTNYCSSLPHSSLSHNHSRFGFLWAGWLGPRNTYILTTKWPKPKTLKRLLENRLKKLTIFSIYSLGIFINTDFLLKN